MLPQSSHYLLAPVICCLSARILCCFSGGNCEICCGVKDMTCWTREGSKFASPGAPGGGIGGIPGCGGGGTPYCGCGGIIGGGGAALAARGSIRALGSARGGAEAPALRGSLGPPTTAAAAARGSKRARGSARALGSEMAGGAGTAGGVGNSGAPPSVGIDVRTISSLLMRNSMVSGN
jgi:hypothetical protein